MNESNKSAKSGLHRLLGEMLDGMLRVRHRTVWWRGDVALERDAGLVFITICPEAAERAHRALAEARVLCDETVGTVAEDGSGRIVPPKPRGPEVRFLKEGQVPEKP